VTVKYKLGHSYDFVYELEDLYCPNCGKKSVWVEQGPGDYYEGQTHVCVECNSTFSMPRLHVDHSDENHKQVIEQIIAGR